MNFYQSVFDIGILPAFPHLRQMHWKLFAMHSATAFIELKFPRLLGDSRLLKYHYLLQCGLAVAYPPFFMGLPGFVSADPTCFYAWTSAVT